MIRFVTDRKPDYVSLWVVFRFCAVWIAWATQKGDYWRGDDDKEVKVGFIRHDRDNSKGRALAFLRLKIGLAWRKRGERR